MSARTGTIEVDGISEAAVRLADRIRSRTAVVVVTGMGYVGLPLAVAFAEAGLRVIGLDVDPERVATLAAGTSPVPDISSDVLARLTLPVDRVAAGETPGGALAFTTHAEVIRAADVVVVCVPTPLDDHREPDLSCIWAAADQIAPHVHLGLLVVLESTSYPGTTEEVFVPCLEHPSAFHHRRRGDSPGDGAVNVIGRDVFLAFSPERIDPGRTDFTVRTTPKVVGGATSTCLEVASALYACAVDTVVPVRDTKTAEMVKLYENTFRLVNIGLVNELALMCDELGIDVWDVIEAAKTKPYGFMPFYPGPGLGGHCIPIDPLYLSWKLRSLGFDTRSIDVATEINSLMPRHVVTRVTDALNDENKAVKGARILLLGMAYKPDVGDVRESPAIEVMRRLTAKGAVVSFHDDHLGRVQADGRRVESVPLDEAHIAEADCVVVLTPHSDIDWALVARHARLVLDTTNALARAGVQTEKVVKL
ncbi:MAG TPA: nucleotide sugar dehydrogenase [Acidimicrobiales bacterium]